MVGSRDPAIDLLRVAALLALIAAHAAVPYMSAPVPELLWPVRQAAGSWVADLVFWWTRCAQPQLFFLLAGVLSAPAVDARGPTAFASARLRRIGVPLLAGVVFVMPVVGVIWAWGWLDSGRVTWAEVRSWRFSDPEIARNSLGPAHLWFLEDLLIVSLIYAAWSSLAARAGWRAIERTGATLIGLVLLGWTILVLRPHVLFEPRNTFVPDPLRIAFGATFFAAGACLARDRQAVGRWPHASILLCGAAVAVVVVVRLLPDGTVSATRSIALASSATAMIWLSVLGSLRLVHGREFVLPPMVRRLAGALAASTYPIYVLHLPILGAVQILCYPHVPNAVVAIALVCIATLALTWLLVDAATRSAAAAPAIAERVRSVPLAAWTTAVIVLGVGLRVLQYLRNPDVWDDRSVLRLIPLVASCAALAVFLPVTSAINRRLAPVAVLLMASSIKLIGHAAEATPDTLDVLLATAAASIFVLTGAWSIAWRAMFFTLVAPLAVWATDSGVFVIGGIAGALALDAWTERRTSLAGSGRESHVDRHALGLAVPAAVLAIAGVSFILLFARSLIGIADYCFRPFGGLLLIPITIGVGAMVSQGRHALAALLILPLILAAAAGIAGQYPFNESRAMVFALPALAVLAAEGLGAMLSRMPAHSLLLRTTVLALALLPPLVLCARELISPSPRADVVAGPSVVLSSEPSARR